MSSLLAYLEAGILTVAVTLAILAATKVPAIVMLIAASLVSTAEIIYAWWDLGYRDPFAPIAFVVLWFYSAFVSLGTVGMGRAAKWPYFLPKPKTQ